jgi:uncharacterized protein YyaL (SSP411 family)
VKKIIEGKNQHKGNSMTESRHTNRLSKEKSPYLLQHAHNPVDWYPWGDEAFQAARAQDKPIFLSVGYATCHWCHVMEHECFEDEHIARQMNETFINIKVDREELPEVDSLYMEFAQSMMTGAVGWPLNVLLTPDLKPFFAATYLPPKGTQGMMGMDQLIHRIKEVWSSGQREKLLEQATKIVDAFSEAIKTQGDELPSKEEIENASEIFFKLADPIHGGLKGVPKFPIGYQASFLLRAYRQLQEGRALFMVERTLDMMHRGGIYDHLGGGFARYAVDELWLIPHFEKMLYDNAILVTAYVEAWLVTGNSSFKDVAQEVCDYILRDMTDPQGGFYSAEDADSEGQEGLFYTWTVDEIEQELGKEEAQLFCRIYDVTAAGNFDGRNILHTPTSIEEVGDRYHIPGDQLAKLLARQRRQLFEVRDARIHPFKDDKVLTAWNGLMIHSLALAGCALDEVKYLQAAEKAAAFIHENLWKKGRLLRRWREGEARYNAGLDEYAFMIKGLLTLFEAGRGSQWLSWAIQMAEVLQDDYKSENGAFLQTDGTDPNIILRKCPFADGAEPSGNAIHTENLLRLYALTNNKSYLEQAEDVMKAVKRFIVNYPLGYCYHLMSIERYYDTRAATVVVALNDHAEHLDELRHAIYGTFHPHLAVVWRREGDNALFNAIPFVKQQIPKNNKTTVYICYRGVCDRPLVDLDEILTVLSKL